MAASKKTSRAKAPPKIIQIIPRQDSIHAYFEDEEEEDGDAIVISQEVIAWGLRSDGSVTGLVAPEDEATAGTLESVDALVNFMGYSGPGAHQAYQERLDGESEDEEEGE
jgi:hypothetical protein